MVKVEVKLDPSKQVIACKEFKDKADVGVWLRKYKDIPDVYFLLTDGAISYVLLTTAKDSKESAPVNPGF